MSRIPLPTPETYTPEQRAVHDKVVAGPRGVLRGPLRAALYNAELADHWQAMGALLRYRTELPPRLSELAILVTAQACSSPFEWQAHRVEAQKAGIEEPIIEALREGREPPGMRDDDAIVWRFASELNAHRSVSDASYQRALDRFGAKAVVELVALVGYYTLVAMTLNAHEIPMREGEQPELVLPQKKAPLAG